MSITEPSQPATLEQTVTTTSKRPITFPEVFVVLNGCLPLVMLIYDAKYHQLGPNPISNSLHTTGLVADLQERVRHIEIRMTTIRNEIHQITKGLLSQQEAEVAMFSFDAVWESMTLRDQIRLIGLVVKQVDYDGESGRVTITFNPIGIRNRAQHATKDLTEVPA